MRQSDEARAMLRQSDEALAMLPRAVSDDERLQRDGSESKKSRFPLEHAEKDIGRPCCSLPAC